MSSSPREGHRGNILILTVHVPFTKGGAETLIAGLERELRARDYCVDIVGLPFTAQPKTELVRQMALWRGLPLAEFAGRKVDLVIATKFPSYLVNHPCKVLWLIHQHRQLYELYGTRFGDFDQGMVDETLRQLVFEADSTALEECQRIFTISENVGTRLHRYLGVQSEALSPPLPLGSSYTSGAKGDYILSVGRLCSIKRIDLMIRAMAQVDDRLKLKVVGLPDEPAIESYLKSEIERHHLWSRVEFLGRVEDAELLSLYANAFAVYYAPYDEDYGYVTLEARASGRPVVTATDSGTVLQFIQHERNGLVAEPVEGEIAQAFNRLLKDEVLYQNVSGCNDRFEMSWDMVIERLTEPLRGEGPVERPVEVPVRAAGGGRAPEG